MTRGKRRREMEGEKGRQWRGKIGKLFLYWCIVIGYGIAKLDGFYEEKTF